MRCVVASVAVDRIVMGLPHFTSYRRRWRSWADGAECFLAPPSLPVMGGGDGIDQSTEVSMNTGVWSEGFSPLRACRSISA